MCDHLEGREEEGREVEGMSALKAEMPDATWGLAKAATPWPPGQPVLSPENLGGESCQGVHGPCSVAVQNETKFSCLLMVVLGPSLL